MKNQSRQQFAELEKLLVREFRSLQQLAAVTSSEREVMPGKKIEAINHLVEEKEQILDQLNLLLDKRRQVIQQLCCTLGVPNESSSLQELLPYLSADEQERLTHLIDGINSLVSEVRDMNYGNIALANSLLTFIQSAQALMISSLQKQIDYRPNSGPLPPSVLGPAGFDQRV